MLCRHDFDLLVLLTLGKWDVVVIESHTGSRIDLALKIETVTHARAQTRRTHDGRWGHRATGSGWWSRWTSDAIPGPHRVRQVVPDWPCPAVVRRCHSGIETIIYLLPLGPQSIDVAVQEEEQRIASGGADAGNGTAETRVR